MNGQAISGMKRQYANTSVQVKAERTLALRPSSACPFATCIPMRPMPAVYAPGEASEVLVCSGRRRERETVKQRRVGGGSVSNVVQRSNGGSTSAGGPRKPDLVTGTGTGGSSAGSGEKGEVVYRVARVARCGPGHARVVAEGKGYRSLVDSSVCWCRWGD